MPQDKKTNLNFQTTLKMKERLQVKANKVTNGDLSKLLRKICQEYLEPKKVKKLFKEAENAKAGQ